MLHLTYLPGKAHTFTEEPRPAISFQARASRNRLPTVRLSVRPSLCLDTHAHHWHACQVVDSRNKTAPFMTIDLGGLWGPCCPWCCVHSRGDGLEGRLQGRTHHHKLGIYLGSTVWLRESVVGEELRPRSIVLSHAVVRPQGAVLLDAVGCRHLDQLGPLVLVAVCQPHHLAHVGAAFPIFT